MGRSHRCASRSMGDIPIGCGKWPLQRIRLVSLRGLAYTRCSHLGYMHKPIKYVEKAVTLAAGGAWFVFDKLNQIRQNPSFKPNWSDKPLLKSYQKQKPPLGW